MRKNKISNLLFVCAIVLFVGAIGAGIFLGNRFGVFFMPEMSSGMDFIGETRFNWSVAFPIWGSGIFLSLVLLFMSELLNILDRTHETVLDKTKSEDHTINL
ncbi:MAG: hypothetical protein GX829_05040 [Clostridium sp.]|nr:hypothetical protein [Clostridium sp.]